MKKEKITVKNDEIIYSDGLKSFFQDNGVSLLFSTYQSNKIVSVGCPDGSETLKFGYFDVDRPMGIARSGNKFAMASKTHIKTFLLKGSVFCESIKYHESHQNTYDSSMVPSTDYYTGATDTHEMVYSDNELTFVNTRFNCIAKVDKFYNWVPVWKPNWVKKYTNGDICHVNGICTVDGKAKYATCVSGTATTVNDWKKDKLSGGVIIDIQTNNIICSGLSMPHSPRIHQGNLYVLDSGNGTFLKVDVLSGKKTVICELPGFGRGLTFFKNIAAIGVSKVRETSSFGGLPISNKDIAREAGIWFVDINKNEIVGRIKLENSISEIFSVNFLPTRMTSILSQNICENYTNVISQPTWLPDEVLSNFENLPENVFRYNALIEDISENISSENDADHQKAENNILTLLEENGDSFDVLKLYAVLLAKQKKYQDVVEVCDRILAIDNQNFMALFTKRTSLLELNLNNSAEEVKEEILKYYPSANFVSDDEIPETTEDSDQ